MTRHDTLDFDLGSQDFWDLTWAERAECYAYLREVGVIPHFGEAPLPGMAPGPGFYAITRHADIAEISANPATWSSAAGAFRVQDLPREFLEMFGSMINMDAPEHLRCRRVVSKVFTPKSLGRTLDLVEAVATDVVDRALQQSGTFDFVGSIAFPYPLRVICAMLGIPDELMPEITQHVIFMTSGRDPKVLQGRDPVQSFLDAGAAMVEIVRGIAEQRLRRPQDDLITQLAVGEVDGERLTPVEIGSFFILLVAAGSETTRTSLAHGMLALESFPEERARWLADVDGLTPTAVDEIVRWASPINFMRRTALAPVTVAGHRFEVGDKALMFYGAANRDAAVFVDPDRLDLGRDPNPSVSYGAGGPHFCLGVHLARRELSVMFRQLLTRMPDLHVVGPAVPLNSDFLNGVVSLPVARTGVA